MAKQGISTGSSPNDGLGDSLLTGAIKINSNFTEIYNTFGNGTNLVSYASTSGISSVSLGLTGTPSITVNKIIAGVTSSIIPFLWSSYGDLPLYSSYHGAVAHAHDTGKLYYAHTRWVELVNTEIDGTVGTGTENYKVGVLTATSLKGNGAGLTGVGISFQNQSTPVGIGITINFIGTGVTVTNTAGVATVNITAGGGGGGSSTLSGLTDVSLGAYVGLTSGQLLKYDGPTGKWVNQSIAGLTTESDPVFTASVAFGITATNITNWNNAYSWGDHNLVGYATGGFVINQISTVVSGASTFSSLNVSGVSTFINGPVLIGSATSTGTTSQRLQVTGGTYISGNTGIGTTNSTSKLHVIGDVRVVGTVTATSFVGDGSLLTGITASGSGIVVKDDGSTVGTAGTIDFGTGLSVSPVSAGVVTVTASGGTSSQWTTTSAGIHTLSNVGVGTTNPTSKFDVLGDAKISGVVTATRFDSTSTGTPTIGAATTISLETITVAISTDATVGRKLTVAGVTTITNGGLRASGVVTATSFSGSASGLTNIPSSQLTGALPALDGSALTGVVGSGSGIVIKDDNTTVGTAGTIDFGNNLSVSAISAGVVTVTVSGGSQWTTTAAGIHTLSNVGIGTTNPTSLFQVGYAGTNTNMFVVNSTGDVAIGTDSPVHFDGYGVLSLNGGTVNASPKSAGGGNIVLLSEGQTFLDAFAYYDEGEFNGGITSAINFSIYRPLRFSKGFSYSGGIGTANALVTFEDTSVGIGTTNATSTLTVKGNTSLQTLNVSGVATATSFRTNSTVGDGTDVGFAIKYYITANGASAYRFAGPGLVNTTDNPTIYLHRGFTYIFENSTGGSHPFAIRYSSGGTGYGSTYLSGSQSGTQVFTIPFDAPSSLVYQCTIHSGMVGTFTIVQ